MFTADDTTMFAQLSYLNGLIKFDLTTGTEIKRSNQPLSEFALSTYANYDEYPHDSAHHGLAISGDGSRLCDCGTIDNTVAIVSTDELEVVHMIDVGMVPYWATTSPDGKHCLVSMSGDDSINLDEIMEKGSEALGQKYLAKLPIKDGRTTVRVDIEEIDWIDAAGDYMCVHVDGVTHILRGTMKKLEDGLDPKIFQRVHRSTIVNINRVKELRSHMNGEYFLSLDNGVELKLSRHYKEKIKYFVGV